MLATQVTIPVLACISGSMEPSIPFLCNASSAFLLSESFVSKIAAESRPNRPAPRIFIGTSCRTASASAIWWSISKLGESGRGGVSRIFKLASEI
jgi:hypothetical protein